MPRSSSGQPPYSCPILLCLGLLVASAPSSIEARLALPRPQEQANEPDSAALLEEAREEQRRFERYRERRLSPEWSGFGGQCDALVGRMCLRHGDGDAPPVASEPLEVEMARMELLRSLGRIGALIPRDRWVLGQRVHYLLEQGEWLRAEALTERCHADDVWWCLALRGYLLQSQGRSVAAEEIFRASIAEMPEEERRSWQALDYLLDDDARTLFEDTDAEAREALRRMLWLLSDPLYLVEGNDREAEQYARRTLIRIREGAENAYDLPWEEDLEELVARYGGEIGWEQGRPVRPPQGLNLRDNRFIIGRHRPHGREFLPAGEFLADPAGIPVPAWEIEDRAPWSAYAPWYAPIITTMDAQTGRFRRGDSLLVVAAYRSSEPTPEATPTRVRDTAPGDNPFAAFDVPPPIPEGMSGTVESGAFVLTLEGEALVDRRGSAREGVVTARVPNGEYILGVEVLDESADRGWRIRGGVRQDDLPFGLAAVSDVLLLNADGDLPESLDEALPDVLPSVRMRSGRTFVVAWEVYGLRTGESAVVGITLQDADPGLLERAGQFLRLTTPEAPVEMSWQEAGPDQLGTVFRAVALTLPEVEPGDYELILTVQLSGRSPIEVGTRLQVDEG